MRYYHSHRGEFRRRVTSASKKERLLTLLRDPLLRVPVEYQRVFRHYTDHKSFSFDHDFTNWVGTNRPELFANCTGIKPSPPKTARKRRDRPKAFWTNRITEFAKTNKNLDDYDGPVQNFARLVRYYLKRYPLFAAEIDRPEWLEGRANKVETALLDPNYKKPGRGSFLRKRLVEYLNPKSRFYNPEIVNLVKIHKSEWITRTYPDGNISLSAFPTLRGLPKSPRKRKTRLRRLHCRKCGALFIATHRIYCSEECATLDKNCVVCGGHFRTQIAIRKLCGKQSCSDEYYRRYSEEKNKSRPSTKKYSVKNCLNCLNPFIASGKKIFCSRSCRYEKGRERSWKDTQKQKRFAAVFSLNKLLTIAAGNAKGDYTDHFPV